VGAVKCGVDSYSPGLKKQRACVPCPTGFTTNGTVGATSPTQCCKYLGWQYQHQQQTCCSISSKPAAASAANLLQHQQQTCCSISSNLLQYAQLQRHKQLVLLCKSLGTLSDHV
jgi:hypothetical protein